jgi:alpha-L-rhamnosidase
MAALANLIPSRLRCEYLANPIGIDEPAPRLSWIVTSNEHDAKQTAYRILVASTPDNLKKGVGDLWDSGGVATDETINVEYRGTPLKPGQRAWWTVEVTDKHNETSRAQAAFWEAGLTKWTAKWIGRPDPVKTPIDESGAKWIWYPEGDPTKEAPTGDRIFRHRFTVSGAPKSARAAVAVDDSFTLSVNGKQLATGRGWAFYTEVDLTSALKSGENEIEIRAHNGRGRAGLLALIGVTQANGENETIRTDKSWQSSMDGAQWQPAMETAEITSDVYGAPKSDIGAQPAVYLRKKVAIDAKVVRARAYTSAKGLYLFSVDGKRVSADIFRPGWTDYKHRVQYQTYDITTFLSQGAHSLEMVVGDGWYCGHVGLAGRENYGPKPLGLCQVELEFADGSTKRIVTDGSWEVGEGPIRTNDLLMGENFDARIRPTGWSKVEVQDQDVPVVAQHAPSVRELAELKAKTIKEPKPGVFVFDLGQNMVGWARLHVNGKAGDMVTLRFAEMLNPDGTIYTTNLRGAKCTDTYTLAGNGPETYEPSFTFHGFRYVEVTGYPGKPGKGDIAGIVVGSDVATTGTFDCSNAMVNQLQHNIFWGQRGNYLEVPTDCPQRDERLGWMGDAQIFARTATYNNDIAAFMTKWVQDVRDAQSEPGGYSDVSPRIGDMSDGAPAWGDAGVIVPWTMYLAYGDIRLLHQHYESMKAWIDYIDSVNPDHIWVKRSNNNFGDWLNVHDDTPRPVIATAYFAHSTDLFARIATLVGEPGDAAKYTALRDQIRKAFVDHFVAADGKIEGDTQTSYVLSLWFNLLPEGRRANAIQRLSDHILVDRLGHLSTGFVGVGYLCPTLTAAGRTDIAYKLLETDTYPSWGYSIRHGATTIWERWDGWTEEHGFQDPGMNSFNHYSLGSVGEWMFATVAGIDFVEPSFKHILIKPIPGGNLTWANAKYDSIRGRIESGWTLKDGKLEMKIVIPANTTATVHVPTEKPDTILVNGKKAAGPIFDLGSGIYTITAG